MSGPCRQVLGPVWEMAEQLMRTSPLLGAWGRATGLETERQGPVVRASASNSSIQCHVVYANAPPPTLRWPSHAHSLSLKRRELNRRKSACIRAASG
jgi:hypothetical protein